jgi:hypothetical protein
MQGRFRWWYESMEGFACPRTRAFWFWYGGGNAGMRAGIWRKLFGFLGFSTSNRAKILLRVRRLEPSCRINVRRRSTCSTASSALLGKPISHSDACSSNSCGVIIPPRRSVSAIRCKNRGIHVTLQNTPRSHKSILGSSLRPLERCSRMNSNSWEYTSTLYATESSWLNPLSRSLSIWLLVSFRACSDVFCHTNLSCFLHLAVS